MGLTAEEQNAVLSAAEAWCAETCEEHCRYVFEVRPVGTFHGSEVPEGTIGVVIRPMPNDNMLGLTSRWVSWDGELKSSVIGLREGMHGLKLRSTVLHEFGHALGLNHVSHGVMAQEITEEFSAEDRAQIYARLCR